MGGEVYKLLPGIWNESSEQKYWLKWLNQKRYTTLFIDGNHENFDLLKTYPTQIWNGGKVHIIGPRLIHLMRGQVYTIEGKRVFTMGGASSHDISDGILDMSDPDFVRKYYRARKLDLAVRVNHLSWWKEELPSETEYAEAVRNLDAVNWKVDIVVSHCCPSSVAGILGAGMYKPDRLTDWFEGLSRRLQFKHWYFGHYHDDRDVLGRYHLRYRQIERIA